MTVFGPMPASEIVHVASPIAPGLRSEINARRTILHRASDAEGPHIADHPQLVLALARAFDPACDRILWEGLGPDPNRTARRSPLSAGSGEIAHGADQGRSRDELVEVPQWFSEVREGNGLSVALGMSAARSNLRQTHWIVVVASAKNLLRSLSHETIEQLRVVESRLLIVVVDDGQTWPDPDRDSIVAVRAGQFDQLDSRWLSELGLPCCAPLTDHSTSEILAELQKIVQAQSTVVLHLRVPALPRLRTELPTESRGRGVLRLLGRARRTGIDKPSIALDAAADELQALARIDPRVVVVVQDSLRSRFPFCRRLPERSYRLPAAGLASFTRSQGLAIGGCRPFILVTSRYLQQSLDHYADQLCESRQAVTLLVEPNEDRFSNQAAWTVRQSSDLAFLRVLPETIVAVPRDERELRQLVRWSVTCAGPVAIQLPRRFSITGVPQVETALHAPIELGHAVVVEEGEDVAIVALGPQVAPALRVADELSKKGVSAGVVNARFLNPVDRTLLSRLARQVSGIVTFEDKAAYGGFGTAVLEQLAADGLSTRVLVSGANAPEEVPSGAESRVEIQRLVEQILEFIDEELPQAYDDGPHERDAAHWSSLSSFDVAPETLRRERESILSQPLSPVIKEWVTRYLKVGHRPTYLWQWCQRGVELTTLPIVLPEWRTDVCDSKMLSIMINVLLDDVADREGGSHVLLEELLQITRGHRPDAKRLSSEEQEYAEFVLAIWTEYWARVARYPNFHVFGDLLQYDLSQLFNTIRYSNLLNRNPHLLNMVEHDLYSPHSMMQMSFATVDLSCTRDFPWDSLGKLREAIWHSQCMGRIGNLVTTWQREIPCRDFTSGVFAHAVTSGDLTVGDLLHAEPKHIEAVIHRGGHEDHFLKEWRYHLRRLHALRRRFEAFDLGQVIQGLKQLLVTELASRGLK